MRWLDTVTILVVALPLWWALFPRNAVRFYRWFHGQAGMDQRRLDAMTPRQFRIAGILFLALLMTILVLANR